MRWKNLTFFLLVLHLLLFQWHKTQNLSSSSNPSWGQFKKNKQKKPLRGQTQEGGREGGEIVEQHRRPSHCVSSPALLCSHTTLTCGAGMDWVRVLLSSDHLCRCWTFHWIFTRFRRCVGTFFIYFFNVTCWRCWSRRMPPVCAARLHCIRLLPFL